jgi:prophage regulatory protein
LRNNRNISNLFDRQHDAQTFAHHVHNGAHVNTTSQESFVRLPGVMQMTGLRRSQIYKLAKCGNFPKPVRLGTRCSVWVNSEVARWIDERIAASRAH